MNKLFIIVTILFFSCSCSKKNNTSANNTGGKTTSEPLPICINYLVDSFKIETLQNPPRKVYSYTYKDKTVYYVPPVCCDQYSTLYDNTCNIISHPDGGFTGRGDGRTPDFFDVRKNEVLIWKDER